VLGYCGDDIKGSDWNIKENIKQINQFSQLDMISELIADALWDFPSFIRQIASDATTFPSYTNPQVVAIGLVTPIPLNPSIAYQVLLKIVNSSGFRRAPAK
jgi:hypothetical protein